MEIKKQRDISIDIIKGIGIFCMVAGHSGSPIRNFVYLFHMAIFFIASGYCYKETNASDFRNVMQFIKKKFLTLWFPFVLWTSIYSILHNVFIRINVYTDNPLLLEYVSGTYISTVTYWSKADMVHNILNALIFQGNTQMGGAFWFLYTLMVLSVCYCIIDYILNKTLKHNHEKVLIAQLFISVVFLAFGFYCFKTNRYLYGINRVFSFYILFYGGYVFKNFRISSRDRSTAKHIAILIITFAILLICNHLGSIELGSNSYVNPVYLLIVSFTGWQFLYEISFFIKNLVPIRNVLVCMGQNTLAVVILHFLSFKIVSYAGVLLYHQPLCLVAAFPVLYTGGCWWIAYTFTGLAVPIFLSILYKKLKSLCSIN